MKISLATNFDNELIDQIKGYPVYELYGKLKGDIIGGGRPDNSLSNISDLNFKAHVKKARRNGINFNYLLNASCLANVEQDKVWQSKLRDFLEYLKSVGVNALTVTNPFILQFVKKNFDCFTVRVSTFACVDSFAKAKYWQDLGADYICVDFTKINRNFKELKYMVDNLSKAKIEILVTNSCLKDCPIINAHTAALSHASGVKYNEKYEDWCLFFCQSRELNNLVEYIKSPWVRPEDIVYYEQIGIEHFKITERDFPTSELVKRVKAYVNRKYDGNLLDLIQGHGWGENEEEVNNRLAGLETRQEVYNEIKRVRGIGCKRIFPQHIYIDNKKLKDFILFFVNGKCNSRCDECGFCKRFAEKVITVDKKTYNYLKQLYSKYDDLKIRKL